VLQHWFGESGSRALLETLKISVRACVLDTNSLLNLISYSLRKHSELPLLKAAELGGVRLLASTVVRDEVPEKIREKCPHLIHMDPHAAEEAWYRDFAPHIIFIDTSALPLLSLRVERVEALDRDDMPTGQLIELFSPHTVYSNDKAHLGHFTILGQQNAPVSTAYRDKSIRDTTIVGVHIGGGIVITLSVPAFQGIGRLLGRLDWRLASGIALAGVFCLVIAAKHPRSRRWLQEHWAGLLYLGGQALEAFAEMEQKARKAEQFLVEVGRTDPPPRLAFHFAARILATAPGPLSSRELTARMIMLGYKSKSEHPHYYVARVLRKHSELFEEIAGSRWQLRSFAPAKSSAR
jgi:hypothetical protein